MGSRKATWTGFSKPILEVEVGEEEPHSPENTEEGVKGMVSRGPSGQKRPSFV